MSRNGWLAVGAVGAVLLVVLMLGAKRVTQQLRGALVTLDLVPIPGGHLVAPAAQAFERMRAAAAADRVTFQVNSAWRSNAEQADLRGKYERGERSAVAAPVGYSNHEAGRAVDIESGGGTNAAFRWLTAHAHRFGFRRTVASEPWHWEFTA